MIVIAYVKWEMHVSFSGRVIAHHVQEGTDRVSEITHICGYGNVAIGIFSLKI